jgi:hypothetical protein
MLKVWIIWFGYVAGIGAAIGLGIIQGLRARSAWSALPRGLLVAFGACSLVSMATGSFLMGVPVEQRPGLLLLGLAPGLLAGIVAASLKGHCPAPSPGDLHGPQPTGTEALRWSGKPQILLVKSALVAVVSLALALALICLVEAFMDGKPGKPPQGQRWRKPEDERREQLERRIREVQESGRQREGVVLDLIGQEFDLRDAAGRYRAACEPLDLQMIHHLYPEAATEEEQIFCHLFFQVGKKLEAQPDKRAERLARLQLERAMLHAEDIFLAAVHP